MNNKINEGYELLGGTKVKCFRDYYKALEEAEKLGLKEAEYGDVYGKDFSYCYWNETGDRYEDEEVIAYYKFDENGKPIALSDEEARRVEEIKEVKFDDLDECLKETSDKEIVKNTFGMTNKEAKDYLKKADKNTVKELRKGFEQNAKKSFLTDSVKEKKTAKIVSKRPITEGSEEESKNTLSKKSITENIDSAVSKDAVIVTKDGKRYPMSRYDANNYLNNHNIQKFHTNIVKGIMYFYLEESYEQNHQIINCDLVKKLYSDTLYYRQPDSNKVIRFEVKTTETYDGTIHETVDIFYNGEKYYGHYGYKKDNESQRFTYDNAIYDAVKQLDGDVAEEFKKSTDIHSYKDTLEFLGNKLEGKNGLKGYKNISEYYDFDSSNKEATKKLKQLIKDIPGIEFYNEKPDGFYFTTDNGRFWYQSETIEINESKKCSDKKCHKKLNEGTSNFWSMKDLPLLIFDMYEDAYDYVWDITREQLGDDVSDDEIDQTEEFEKNFDKYYDYCLLDEEEQKSLQQDINEFNEKAKNDAYEDEEDYYNNDYPVVEIKPGYYQAAQLWCDTKHISDKAVEKVAKFFDEMKKKYGLTQLGVSYRFSNGETGYHKIEEDLDNDILNKTIKVYDIDALIDEEINKDSDKQYQTFHFNEGAAIIVGPAGGGCIVDYEAIGKDFKSVDEEVEIAVCPKERTDENGHRVFSIVPTATLKCPVKELMEAPSKEMKVKDFFYKHDYNDRCRRNFKDIIPFLEENINESKNSLKESEQDDKTVIYKVLGTYTTTPKSNYDARIQNAQAIHTWKDFESAQEIIDYCIKYGWAKDASDFIVIDK